MKRTTIGRPAGSGLGGVVGVFGAVMAAVAAAGAQNTERILLAPEDPFMDDEFGNSVSLSGNRALVGAYDKFFWNGLTYLWCCGAAYLFDVDTGRQLHKFLPDNIAQGDLFGCSVSLSGDLALIGAPVSGPT